MARRSLSEAPRTRRAKVGPGQFVRPTIYRDVTPDMRIAREEIFGPVLAVIAVDSEEEAVTIANDTDYGLVAAIWTQNLARAHRLARLLQAGQVAVNDGPLGVETPFGGFKQSGHGREKGLAALQDYTQTKTISVSLT